MCANLFAMNKFVKQYSKIWTPKVGDRIQIVKYRSSDSSNYFKIGDFGTIVNVYILPPTDQKYDVLFDTGERWWVAKLEINLL